MKRLADRKYFIIYFIIIASAVLIFKIAQLQLFTSKYKEQARRTTLEKSLVYPSRGLIYDRNEKGLVINKPIYVITAVYNKVNPAMDTIEFCALLGIDKKTFIENLNKDWSSHLFSKSLPFVFLSKVSPEQFAIFQEHMYKFPGFYASERSIRGYPHHFAAHVLGYLGEVDKKTVENSEGYYLPGDFIGKSGLESAYERVLGGGKGVNYILKDNRGRQVGSFDNGRLDSLAISGEDMQISIDLELQAYGDSLMLNKRGAIVAIDPNTGEILAMISAPAYDPNILNLDERRGLGMGILLNDTINRPLNNRAVSSKYPPGSIFKPILSLIAMQKQTTWPSRTIYCPGFYRLSATKVQKCHAHPPATNISAAVQYSCNTYYFQLIREFLDQYGYKKPGLGLDTLVSYLKDFGLGERLGLDYSYENKGLIPTSEYYDRLYHKEAAGWRSAWVLSLGIGQGELQLTTVQMANLAAILANRGYFYTPHFIKKFLSGRPIPTDYKTMRKVRIDPKYFPYVIDGLERVVTSGTARIADVPGLHICGKTGTAENPHGKDHSVFFGFAPKDKPKIAIAVFVENAGFGAQWAAPIASLMIEKHINGTIMTERKYLEEKMFKGILIDLPYRNDNFLE
ncbi:MAG: penicillin-binding protein 2 [Saprospiraceae bacterium]|nr:penicillin-binding protein 2 [Saprospiraceae bacterium]